MGRILVVDDNRPNLDLMLYLLKAFGHDAHGCANGTQAIEAARAGHFDLVLSDVLMPEMDGYELARRLRVEACFPRLRLVAVTALAMVGDRERVMNAGFDGYLAKPIDAETFVSSVDAYLPADKRSRGSRI